jgi:hypothetical protein
VKEISEVADVDKRYCLTPDEIGLINPNTGTCPLFRNHRDAQITKAIYGRAPILLSDDDIAINRWGISFYRMFDMANDSQLFVSFDAAQDHPCKSEAVLVRVYEGKMFHQFNHRFASASAAETGQKLRGASDGSELAELQDPHFTPTSRYLVHATDLPKWSISQNGILAFRRVGGVVANVRTMVSSVLPRTGCGDSVFIVTTSDEIQKLLLCATFNSFAFDYVLRNKMSGINLSYFIIKQLPVPPPAIYAESCAWGGQPTTSLCDWLLPRMLELTYTAWDLEPFARDCNWTSPPFRWDDERRFLLRCELDAAFFHLYGLDREDAAYIMDTFPIVKRKDEEKHGTYRTKDTILEIYDAMQTAIETGKPYQTRLDPPPADPRCCHPAKV